MSWLLPYYALVFATVFVWPTWRLWKRERIKALVLPTTDTAEGVIGVWFKGLIVAVAATVGVIAAGGYDRLGPLLLPLADLAALVGWALLTASLLWMALAQAQMGRSWRIGIDPRRTALVRTGLFGVSRNPIFLGLRCNLLGLFLVAPCAATLTVLLLGEALMQVQVRLEEAHLRAMIGADYQAYVGDVRRWI